MDLVGCEWWPRVENENENENEDDNDNDGRWWL
jgi:hypothetical protein